MGYSSRINKAFEGALRLPLNADSKYVIFSDCHRGTGKANDNFTKNELIYIAALNHYLNRNFTYIELGDGDELWENRKMDAIKKMHQHSFDVLTDFYGDNRFYAVYGNHDMIKKSPDYRHKHFASYYCDNKMCDNPLFPDITFYEAIILEGVHNSIYLTHGHQADVLNSTFWHVSRFLVRYLWRPLEFLGIPDPTSAAKSNTKKKSVEKRLTNWAETNHHILITGHTHRPMMGNDNSPFYNTGSCVSPYGITCIEITGGCISLIKWFLDTTPEQMVFVSKTGGTAASLRIGRQHLRLFFCVHFTARSVCGRIRSDAWKPLCGTPIPSMPTNAASKTLLSDYPRIIERGASSDAPLSACLTCLLRFFKKTARKSPAV